MRVWKTLLPSLLVLASAVLCGAAQAAGELELGKLEKLTSAQVQIGATQKSIDVGKREARWQLKFSNVSAVALHGPLYVTIENLKPPTVVVKNASGVTTSGLPYFVVSAADLPAQESVAIEVVFTLPPKPGAPPITFGTSGYQTPSGGQPPPALAVAITHPGTLITVGSTPLPIEGTINDASATLTVNGAPVNHSGGHFTAQVALQEGHNAIVARAVNAKSEEATATISVSLDTTPPYVTIDSPAAGAVLTSATVNVSGLINDIVRGTVSEGQGNVTVNGRPATIANRSYFAPQVPLQEGSNTIRVEAADEVGNTGVAQIEVTYRVPQGSLIELSSGQDQHAQIRQELPQALAVRLLDGEGHAVPDKPVVFRVSQGDGVVGVGQSDEGAAVLATSDANGIAHTRFRLGGRAGSGNQRVSARSVGFEGEVLFFASATPKPGDKVSVNSGNNQRGAARQALPLPFVVVVSDDGANVIEGAQVEFSVVAGDGRLQNGERSFIASTDSDGRASAKLTLGDDLGLDVHRVSAKLLGTQLSAGFTASALQTGNPGATSISGVVLDNQDRPLPNVTLRVEHTTREAKTDEQGRFKVTEVPVGPVRLIADGSTTSVPGEWPTLPYNIVTVSGADNPLSAPVYMVKLDTAHAVRVGDEDKEITLPEVPGFKLTVKAGSVTFPNSDRVGLLSVTPVNVAKIPMVPPNGMQPQFIVTIQPSGARFDPPAALELPNVDGHVPGAQVEMYSFDHDLEEFVTIGLGTVSADGTRIVSNAGVGVIKAGWHCGSPPGGGGCVAACNACQIPNPDCTCSPASGFAPLAAATAAGPNGRTTWPPGDTPHDCKTPSCSAGGVVQVPDPTDDPVDFSRGDCMRPKCFEDPVPDDSDRPNDACKTCDGGEQKDLEITSVSTLANGFDEVIKQFHSGGITVTFESHVEASHGCELEYEWDFGDGTSGNEPNPTHTYQAAGEYDPVLTVRCAGCAASEKSSRTLVLLPIVTMVTPQGDAVTAPRSGGEGQNEYFYPQGPALLNVDFKLKVLPESIINTPKIAEAVTVEIDPIGLVFAEWDKPGQPGGRTTAIPGNFLTAHAQYKALPAHNRDFGNKIARVKFAGATIETARVRMFFDATAHNHPGDPIPPNWYYYYRDQERLLNPTAHDYVYNATASHCHFESATKLIVMTEACIFARPPLAIQQIINGKRRYVGFGETVKGWGAFVVTLAHERAHAFLDSIWKAEEDPDNDGVITSFELNPLHTDPNDPFTCDPPPGLFLPPERLDDNQCWAMGPPEHDAAAAVDPSFDWALNGLQWVN